jgi:cysteine desulfurase
LKYFDYAATTPLDPEAGDAYIKASTEFFGNTGSLHDIGSEAQNLLENCRQEMASLIGSPKEGIYFTSGGSESNFLAIQALLSVKKKKGSHIISSIAEHSSIRSTLEKLSLEGYEITLLPFNEKGQIEMESIKNATRDDTILITIQHGNSEIGTLQPIREIGAWCRSNEILFHSDCVHTFGKLELKEVTEHVNSLSFSAHKFYGPKGIGVVYMDPKLRWEPYYPGATHENRFRPGTVNLPAIVAMTVAAQKCSAHLSEQYLHAQQLRERLLLALEEIKDDISVYQADGMQQIPHTLGLRLHGIEGQWVMLESNRLGFAISTGSACQTGLTEPSKTMVSMNVPNKKAKEFIRVSFGRQTTAKEVEQLANTFIKIVKGYNHK